MGEETAVGNGVYRCGSRAYRVGTYVYEGSCCKFMCIGINSLSSSCLQKGQARWVYANALFIFAPVESCRVPHQYAGTAA